MKDRTQKTTAQHPRESDQGGIAQADARGGACGSLSREDAAQFQNRLRDLDNLLNELTGLHEELLDVLQRKLVAMRQNGVDAIHECVAREGELAGRIADREGLRRRLMVMIGRDLGIDKEEARGLSIRRLASRVDEKQKSKLLVAGERLSAVLKEIAKVNAVVGEFAGRMLEHYRAVFGQITQSIVQPPVYARDGERPQSVAAQVIDAVG
ncbi:MAG: flagellar export chaperone FlgN [Planctomycetes bacterium]|nr:flagellar export chaperone FlgN [Planctomycetota bacterium]